MADSQGDQFANRELQYNDNLGQVIGRFCTALVEADSAAKKAYVENLKALLGEPNAEFVAETSLIGVNQPLQTKISTPLLSIAKANPFEIQNAQLSLDMTVSASNQDTVSSAMKAGAEGSGKIGWGPFAVQVKVSASMSTNKESKRSSDYRSTTHAEVTMGQGDTPEGLALIIDSLNATTAKALEINQAIIQAKLGQLTSSGDLATDQKLPANGGDGGDQGGPPAQGGPTN